jgi:lysophospholipase L1-like esterase
MTFRSTTLPRRISRSLRLFFKVSLAPAVMTILALALIEGAIRLAYLIRNAAVDTIPLPYVIGYDYGPVPPWLDALRILEPDPVLVWKNRPNLKRKYMDVFCPVRSDAERFSLIRQFIPRIPDSLKQRKPWEIALNSEAYRDAEFPTAKKPSSFRIVCLGDSWTFGANVGQEEAYPQRLRAMLAHGFPRSDFEVFNLGVLGYASYNGAMLMRSRVPSLEPDIVVIAFAMNEPNMAGYREERAREEKTPLVARIRAVLAKSEIYKLLRYGIQMAKYKPRPMADWFKEAEKTAAWSKTGDDSSGHEPWLRDSLRDYAQYHREMIERAGKTGADVILLYNEFWRTSPYRSVLERVSREEQVPLIDASALLAESRKKIEDGLERRLALQPAGFFAGDASPGRVEVVFRVYLGERHVPRSVYIAGTDPQLGDLVPNKTAMYDDGTRGDEHAGDHVWSLSASFPAGKTIFYVYTNSGEEGLWEGLDVPYVRTLTLDPPLRAGTAAVARNPVESFGQVYMHADGCHTNAAGYELIAEALLDVLKRNPKFQAHISRPFRDPGREKEPQRTH